MKSTILYGTVFSIILLISFTACGGDDGSPSAAGGCNGFLWAQEIQDETTALSETASAYGTDPTTANCEIYKDALRDYIDALEGLDVDCIAEADEEEYRKALAEAKVSVDEIDCSDPDSD